MKRKTDFHELNFINPFEPKYINKMVYDKWSNREVLNEWRKENSKWLKRKEFLEYLDIDELMTQWNVDPLERKVGPKTCHMIFKELCIVLRMIDAEHQDAVLSDTPGALPGVVYSESNKKWLYQNYDIYCKDPKKAVKVKSYDSEEEAYYEYQNNRNSMIEYAASKAIEAGLIEESVYEKYFGDADIICVRDYEFYKADKYDFQDPIIDWK